MATTKIYNIIFVGYDDRLEPLLKHLVAQKDAVVSAIATSKSIAHLQTLASIYSFTYYPSFENINLSSYDFAIVFANYSLPDSSLHELNVISGKAIDFVLTIYEHAHTTKLEIKQLLNDARELFRIAVSLTSSEKMEEVLNNLLTEALRSINAPAGSIALYDDKTKTLTLAASHGFSKNFTNVIKWHRREGGMTDHILRKKTPSVFHNIDDYSYIDNALLKQEGIKSLVCVPLIANEEIIGILYIDDFAPRQWTVREIDFLTLLSIQAGYAIEKFKLIETITNTQQYLKSIIDTTVAIVITTDKEGNIVEFNKGAETALGYSRDEVIGKHIEMLWFDPNERRQIIETMKMTGKSYSTNDVVLKTKDNTLIDINLTISFLTDTEGNFAGTVGISKDITERKRLEKALHERTLELQELNSKLEEKVIERTQELAKANKELEKSNKLKSQFIANMSHELRTPLNSILGFSELLSTETFGTLNAKQKRYIQNIYNSGSHLLQLINNVLDIAKIESGKMELFIENFPVQSAIAEVNTVLLPLAKKKNQTIIVNLPDTSINISADKTKFKQILYNLISNAIKFTEEGGTITIDTQKIDCQEVPLFKDIDESILNDYKCLRLSVTDTGIGIKKEDYERIFNEFEQVDGSHSRKYEGSGLGLSLTKKLVEMHGGEITVQSVEGQGSTFTVILPPYEALNVITLKETPNESIEQPQEPPLDEALQIFLPSKKDPPLILIIEDDRSTSEVITLYLAKEGYRLAHVYNGKDAIPKIKELKPFAVILDIMLPDKDGWEILQEIKLDPETKDIPVIISSIVDNKSLGFALGATDYLIKPLDKTQLLQKVNELSVVSKRSDVITILCIDDNTDTLELLRTILESNNYNVITTTSGKDGIEKAITFRPNIIMLDLMMPDMDGFEVANRLKANPLTMDIPVLILTAKDLTVDDKLRLAGKFESFLQKSHFSADDLLIHIRDLESKYPARAGLIDEVSGLFDHSYFQIRLAQEVGRAKRYKENFSLVMIDIDKFAEYVKLFGIHRANMCIKKIADYLRRSLRGSDTLVRYGIDEFAIILSRTSKENAEIVAKRFLSFINTYPFYGAEQMPSGKLTASISLVSFPCDSETPADMIFKSHEILKKIKSQGGGRLLCYGENLSN